MFALWPVDWLNLSTFKRSTFGYWGQTAASEAGHIANTNVVHKAAKWAPVTGTVSVYYVNTTGQVERKINLARARWSSLVDISCRATSLQVVDIPQVNHSPPEQVCNA